MDATQELVLQLHPTDYRRLKEAATLAGQDINDFARLAIHREASSQLALPYSCIGLPLYRCRRSACININD